jgi:protein phosphatase
MGTTIVACLFFDNRISIAHVGDARLYRAREGKFEQMTMDHSLLQELVDRGFYSQEEAARSTNRNYVTRALGVEAMVQVDIQENEVQPGDIYLLCSDGLPDMVEDEDIHLTMSTFNANLQTVGQQLIQLSNEQGGKDNISVILAEAREPFPAKNGLFTKVKQFFK